MQTVYHQLPTESAIITTARTVAPLYGCLCDWSLTTHSVNGLTAVTFGFRPTSTQGGNGAGALSGGRLRSSDCSHGRYCTFEEKVVIPPLHSWVLELTDIRDGGEEAGRTIANALLHKTESLVETVRHSIRRNFSRTLRSKAARILHERSGATTRRTVTGLLAGLDWSRLFKASGCGERCLEVLTGALGQTSPRFRDIIFEGNSGIPVLGREAGQSDLRGIATAKAIALLEQVCGEKLTEEFQRTGRMTVDDGESCFTVGLNGFIEHKDPHGERALLYVHAVMTACNPVDGLVLAYLNVKHRLQDCLSKAGAHGQEPGIRANLVDDNTQVAVVRAGHSISSSADQPDARPAGIKKYVPRQRSQDPAPYAYGCSASEDNNHGPDAAQLAAV